MAETTTQNCDDTMLAGVGPAAAGLAGRDLMRLLDLTPAEFQAVLDTAKVQKAHVKAGKAFSPFAGKAVAVIMEKPSLRTRSSFEIGAAQLGAHPLVMSDSHSAFSRGESIKDTVMVLERFVDCIVLRTYEQSKLLECAKWASIPIINALSDDYHPCQGLADALTIIEHKGKLEGLTMTYVGDGANNMANTYLELGALAGMNVRIGCPESKSPAADVVADCKAMAQQTGATIEIGTDPIWAVEGADVIITDTWTSMGASSEDEESGIFAPYQVNAELMAKAAPDAIFMHCLPAHRGQEVTDEVIDSAQSVVYDEAENRLHAQKAVMTLLIGAL